jgi:hypothetical protein
MPRSYEVTFEQIAVSAAQDLVGIINSATKMARVKRAWVAMTDTTLPTSQMCAIRCRIGTTTITAGSGGAAATPRPVDVGDAAAGFTARVNDTTKQTTSGAYTIVEENGFHAYQGFDKTFASPPVLAISEGFVFELLSTVSGTVHMSGGLELEEFGG